MAPLTLAIGERRHFQQAGMLEQPHPVFERQPLVALDLSGNVLQRHCSDFTARREAGGNASRTSCRASRIRPAARRWPRLPRRTLRDTQPGARTRHAGTCPASIGAHAFQRAISESQRAAERSERVTPPDEFRRRRTPFLLASSRSERWWSSKREAECRQQETGWGRDCRDSTPSGSAIDSPSI